MYISLYTFFILSGLLFAQLILTFFFQGDPWKGGGMGMFSVVSERHVVCLDEQNKQVLIAGLDWSFFSHAPIGLNFEKGLRGKCPKQMSLMQINSERLLTHGVVFLSLYE